MGEQERTAEMIEQARSRGGNLTMTPLLKLARYAKPCTRTVQTLRRGQAACPK